MTAPPTARRCRSGRCYGSARLPGSYVSPLIQVPVSACGRARRNVQVVTVLLPYPRPRPTACHEADRQVGHTPIGECGQSGPGRDQDEGAVEGGLSAQVTVPAVPRPVGQIAGEFPGEAVVHLGPGEAPGRAGQPRGRVEGWLRPAVVRLAEPARA